MKPEKIILNIFSGVSIVMLVIAFFASFGNITRIANERTAPGLVVEVAKERAYLDERREIIEEYYYPVVRFTAGDGRTRELKMSEGSNRPQYEPGDEVEVRYNPQKPLEARIDSFGSNALMWVLPVITGILGLAFGGAVLVVQKYLL
jgi:hypothetical protein